MALFALATVVVPRWRRLAYWRGTSIRCGPLASFGFCLVFAAASVFLLAEAALGDSHRLWITLVLIVGMACIFAGQWFD